MDTQIIYCGDCLQQLPKLPDACVDLVYIDPPFNSNRNYEVFWGEGKEKRAFEDRHASTAAYIDFMRPRCVELARVLKPTGSFYYHCDWHASHYVKVMLDQIFGENSFQNEIVWKRTTAHADTHGFGHVHDIVFRYSNGKAPTFNVQLKPYSEDYIRNYFVFSDEHVATRGKYRVNDITGSGLRNGETGKIWRGIDPAKIGKGRHWMRTPDELEEMAADGRIHFPPKGGTPGWKRYENELKGQPIDSIWDDIPALTSFSKTPKEALGYPTQKPLALLDRIIQASSNPGDIVLDAFCGCGTAIVSAQNLKRKWIGIDISPTACRVVAKRLVKDCKLVEGKDFVVRDLPRSEDQLRKIPPFEFENWAVIALGGIKNKVQVGDMGIDGRIYPAHSTPTTKADHLGFMDVWYPIQVKQKDKAGRPDIDSFEAVMMRENRSKGFFVSFAFSRDALTEIDAFFRREGRVIIPLTVRDILDEELAAKLA
ncbi:MAG: restriction endonuclease [Pyrinomonadaceae bacterium]|nr:restriction endonuclease [Pyrinomonadaceae bacterium]